MSYAKIVEEKILQAMAEGEFDNLPGRGRPLDLDDYFSTPEDRRVGYSLLKSAHFLPPEMELWMEIGKLKEQLKTCAGEKERLQFRRQIEEKSVYFEVLREHYRRGRPSAKRRHSSA